MIRMETTKSGREPYGWWFDSRDTCCVACSPWLLSSHSELNEKTQAMLRLIEEDADTFAQRVEMYYEKRPQLISLVEDFYRAQRSLVEQFDHLRHDTGARDCHTSPLASSYKSCDGCFSKFSPQSKNSVSFPSNRDPTRPLGVYHELAYESEVDDFLPEACYEAEDSGKELKHERLMAEIDKLNEEIMEKEKATEELQCKLFQSENEATKLMQEIKKLRVDNEEMTLIRKRDEVQRELILERMVKKETEKMKAENEVLNNELAQKDQEKRETMKLMDEMKKLAGEVGVVSLKNKEQRELLEMKDEEKREVIRQLSVAVETLKGETVLFKKLLARNDNQMLNSFGWLLNCSEPS